MFISYGFIPQTSYQPVLSKIWFELSDYSKPLWCYTILNMILIAYFLINIFFFLQTSRLKHIFHSKQSTNIALKLNKTNAFMVRTLLVKYNFTVNQCTKNCIFLFLVVVTFSEIMSSRFHKQIIVIIFQWSK